MAFKLYIPKREDNNWADYWQRTSMEENLRNCGTDGLLPILSKYLPKDGKILEAGCGLGKWIVFLKRRGYDISGVDSYPEVIGQAKKFTKNLPIKVDNVAALSLPDNCLDAYLSFGVIEHFEEGPEKPLREAIRVLKKGGIAIVETPNDNPLRRLVRIYETIRHLAKTPARTFVETFKLRPKRIEPEKYFYEYHYTEGELVDHVKQAGFKILGSFPKDDLAPDRSIGLWLDFPQLRQKGEREFILNSLGRLIKKILLPVPEFWSACTVVVAKKE